MKGGGRQGAGERGHGREEGEGTEGKGRGGGEEAGKDCKRGREVSTQYYIILTTSLSYRIVITTL